MKKYARPELVAYGRIEELTRLGGTDVNDLVLFPAIRRSEIILPPRS